MQRSKTRRRLDCGNYLWKGGLEIYEKENVDIVIATGLERGGGREIALVYSCDVIIAVSGGSGTLTEIAIAYQANIPVIVIEGTGGWSQKLANTFLDGRERFKIESRKTPKEAVELAFELIKEWYNKKIKNIFYKKSLGLKYKQKINFNPFL